MVLKYPNLTASGTINPARFVKFGSADYTGVQAAAATDLFIGISPERITTVSGDRFAPITVGNAKLKIGGNVTRGALLTSDANGQGVAGTSLFRVGAIALQSGVVGDIIEVLVCTAGLVEGIASITATAAEINVLDGISATLTAAELSLLDGVTATTAELNRVDSAIAYNFLPKVAKVALAAVDTAGGVFAWTPAANVIVSRVVIDATTQSSAACTLDVGVAANPTTLSDTLIDGLSVATAGTYNNIEHAGTNGDSLRKVSSTQSVTGSVASGASAGLVGFAYIYFNEV